MAEAVDDADDGMGGNPARNADDQCVERLFFQVRNGTVGVGIFRVVRDRQRRRDRISECAQLE